MAREIFTITLIFFAIIVGINSETFEWNGYLVTRETLVKDGVKNFTQSLTRTVDGIKTVDRTVELTNNENNSKISTDHSITTTKNGIVTLDRTYEKFDVDGNVDLHDHFFNISSGDAVTTGRNLTRVINSFTKDVDYLEGTRKRNGELTINRSFVSFPMDNTPANTSNVAIIIKANNIKEIYQKNTIMINDGFIWKKINSNVMANLKGEGDKAVSSTIEKFNQDNEVTFIKQTYAEFKPHNSTIIDTTTTNMKYLKSGFRFPQVEDHFIIIINVDGQKNIEQYITTKRQLGDIFDIISLERFDATIEANETVSKIQTNLRMDPKEHQLYLQAMIEKAKLRIINEFEEATTTITSMWDIITNLSKIYQSILRGQKSY